MLTPAACYPVYPLVGEPRRRAGAGCCSTSLRLLPPRAFEDLDRLQSFRMREYVRIGSPEQIDDFREGWMTHAKEMADQLGPALAHRTGQRSVLRPRRQAHGGEPGRADAEVRAARFRCAPREEPTACMSFNYHRDHFGATWNLRNDAGEVAHTGCVAFGMDRLALALFATHGLRLPHWPAAVRKALCCKPALAATGAKGNQTPSSAYSV